ncbi:MAG: DUF1592 domain-containing protein [Verrucomicrobiota bacterium]
MPIPRRLYLICFILALSGRSLLGADSGKESDPVDLVAPGKDFRPFLAKYCTGCHGDEKQKAELNLEALIRSGKPEIEDLEHWEIVRDLIETREMPPKNKPQPDQSERDQAIAYLDQALESFQCGGPSNPGRVTVRRLNRSEYTNTIRDLLGFDFEPSSDFPRDEVGYGFDNIGDVLSLSPLLMEKYLDAAEAIAKETILKERPVWPPQVERLGKDLRWKKDNDAIRTVRNRVLGFYREGEAGFRFGAPQAGRYQIRIQAYQDKAGLEPASMALSINGKEIERFDIRNTTGAKWFELERDFDKGDQRIAVAYTNNYVNNDHPDRKLRGDRNLFVDRLVIRGPLGQPAPSLPVSHRKLIPAYPEGGRDFSRKEVEAMLFDFASRAFRRPATDSEVERLRGLVEMVERDGGGFEGGMKLALQAMLVSPHFLFRWELDPAEWKSAGNQEELLIRDLGGYEMASRLSYFLWSSMPDEELFQVVNEGRINEPEVLRGQVERMLRDPRSQALVDNFAGQWLQVRNMDSVEPDPDKFPEFDEALRGAMKEETLLFFGDLVRRNGTIFELLDSKHTFLNERLARHYGIEGIDGEHFRRVGLSEASRRVGILTHGSILTITSNPTRTSPVNRGKWVLEQLLGTPPPPPPPDVEELEDGDEASASESLRERLEHHRSKPDCAGCHAKMDPIGFALENFDAIGRWRDFDGRFPIEPGGELPGGEVINDAADLNRVLRGKEDFVENLAEKMLTFAIGRGLEYYDRCVVDEIVLTLSEQDHRMHTLISEIVLSEPFRKRTLLNHE